VDTTNRVDRTFQPSEVGDECEAYRVVSPVELDFDMHKDKDRFRLVGTVHAGLELVCSRCLEPFRIAVDAPFDLRYLPAAAMSTSRELVPITATRVRSSLRPSRTWCGGSP